VLWNVPNTWINSTLCGRVLGALGVPMVFSFAHGFTVGGNHAAYTADT
jgi:hypothetical protein